MQVVVRLSVVKPKTRLRKREVELLLAEISRHGRGEADMQRIFQSVREEWPEFSFGYTGSVLTFRMDPRRVTKRIIREFRAVVEGAFDRQYV